MAFDLRGNVLPLGAECQQLDEVEMVRQVPSVVPLLNLHQLEESGEGVVVVEEKDIVTSVYQLGEEGEGERGGERERWR